MRALFSTNNAFTNNALVNNAFANRCFQKGLSYDNEPDPSVRNDLW